MATTPLVPDVFSRRRISLAEIDAAVSARLGPARGLGNSQPACFNRQVAMYLAKHVSRLDRHNHGLLLQGPRSFDGVPWCSADRSVAGMRADHMTRQIKGKVRHSERLRVD